MLNTLLVLALCFASYLGGLWTADSYHNDMRHAVREALSAQYERLKGGLDADDPRLAGAFEERLQSNGRATVLLHGRKRK